MIASKSASIDNLDHLVSLGTPNDRIEIVLHDPEWSGIYQREAARITVACKLWIVDMEHIGSSILRFGIGCVLINRCAMRTLR